MTFTWSSQKSESFLWWNSSLRSFLPHHHKKVGLFCDETHHVGLFCLIITKKKPQKRHTKETYKRDLQKWLFLASLSQKGPTEETHKQNPKQRLTKLVLFGLFITKNTNRRNPQKWVFLASSSQKRPTEETHKRRRSTEETHKNEVFWPRHHKKYKQKKPTEVGLFCFFITQKTHRRNPQKCIFMVKRLIIITKKWVLFVMKFIMWVFFVLRLIIQKWVLFVSSSQKDQQKKFIKEHFFGDETHHHQRKDPQKRPKKETYKRDPQKRLIISHTKMSNVSGTSRVHMCLSQCGIHITPPSAWILYTLFLFICKYITSLFAWILYVCIYVYMCTYHIAMYICIYISHHYI